jgi:hypothetical protein
VTLAAFLLLVGCKKVEPAPADVDGLARWFWVEYDDASDDDVRAAATNVWAAVDGDALTDDAIDGTVSDLTEDDVAHVELREGTDPTLAAGLFFARTVACPIDKIETIVTALNQDELYEGVYEEYTRTYTTDDVAYFAREVDRIAWTVDIVGQLLGTPYTETLRGGARYIPATGDEPHGDVIVARTWMPEPAVLDSDSRSFVQDYQMEFYAARGEESVHFYAIWRETSMGSGLDQDNETVQRIILNNLADWDNGTEDICAEL